MTLNVQTDRTLIRAGARSTRYVLLSFAAPESSRTAGREPINVAFVIDRSGSMGGSKIDLARQAVVRAVGMLKPSDRFSVVAYDHEINVIVPSTFATAEAVRNAVRQIDQLEARGNTDLGGGWLKGCQELARHLERGQIARCLLLSDGRANEGIISPSELARHAAELRSRGVTTTTIGLGADFDERLLEGMSRAGAGHFYYVEKPVQIGDCLAGELGETLEITARDVIVNVRADAGIDVTTLNDFPVRREGSAYRFELGDLVSRQDAAMVLRLVFPTGHENVTARAVFGVTDSRGTINEGDTELVWTFADHSANDSQHRNLTVDRAVATLYAARVRAEALDLNRAGRFRESVARLQATARRIQDYAGHDAELRAIVQSLEEREDRYGAPMADLLHKSEHFGSLNARMHRSPVGSAPRRPTP